MVVCHFATAYCIIIDIIIIVSIFVGILHLNRVHLMEKSHDNSQLLYISRTLKTCMYQNTGRHANGHKLLEIIQ